MRVAGILLAAGASSRLGRPKQLLLVDDTPLVRVLGDRMRASRCAQIAAVVGSNAAAIEAALAGSGIAMVANPNWEEGMASSIRSGVAWAIHGRFDALLVAVCDQLFLSTAHIDRLIDTLSAEHPVVASRYTETTGVPALFDRSQFPLLLSLRGKHGAQELIRESEHAVSVDFPKGAFDIDTESDVRQLL